MITSKDIEDYYEHPIYPDGPVRVSVTPFPFGILGTQTLLTKLISIRVISIQNGLS